MKKEIREKEEDRIYCILYCDRMIMILFTMLVWDVKMKV